MYGPDWVALPRPRGYCPLLAVLANWFDHLLGQTPGVAIVDAEQVLK